MYKGKTHELFAKYALPQMVGLLFNSVYTIVDGVFIGHRLGAAPWQRRPCPSRWSRYSSPSA